MQPVLQYPAYSLGEIQGDAVGVVGVPIAKGAIDTAQCALAEAA
jgi:hypothetical protein